MRDLWYKNGTKRNEAQGATGRKEGLIGGPNFAEQNGGWGSNECVLVCACVCVFKVVGGGEREREGWARQGGDDEQQPLTTTTATTHNNNQRGSDLVSKV